MSKQTKAAAPPIDTRNVLRILETEMPGKTAEQVEAETAQSPIYAAAQTARLYSNGTFGISDLTASVETLRDKAKRVQNGDTSDMEAMFTAQATTLDVMFNEFARRAALNMGQYIEATETYMRLALKAQSQCRTTLEALAEIKNPRQVAFVKQANIAHGPQQVNNGTPTQAAPREEIQIQANELSGKGDHELLPHPGASQTAIRIDTAVETVAKVYRPHQ